MRFKTVALLAFLVIGTIGFAEDINGTQKEASWEETLGKVIDLRQKLLNEYNECLAKADGNESAESICAQSLRDGGKELDDMRDGTGAYAKVTEESKNVYEPTEEDKRKDKKLSECFDKTEGKPECYHKFEELNATAYENYVNSIPAPEKK